MTDRERIMCALTGVHPDRIAWVPRLEFWYRGRRHTNTLPVGFRDLTLAQVIEKLNVGWYGTIPDFTDCDDIGGIPDRTLGILRSKSLPYEIIIEGVDRIVKEDRGQTVVEYNTPVGSIRTASKFTEEMLKGGVSTSYITDHAIKETRDIDVVGYIFSHIKVIPSLNGYMKFRSEIGDKGIAVALTSGAACPIQHIMRTLMPMENFYYALMAECPEKIFWLADQMEGYYSSIKEIAANSSAEVVMLGGNYDAAMTPPPFFREHILPSLRDYAGILHKKGKYLMTHTDGENQNLLPLYLEAEFDVADSVCPAPMTSNSLDEIREILTNKITIWGGIPSVLLCAHSCEWGHFKSYIDNLLNKYGHESHFVLGVSDMVTADAELDRIMYITEKVNSI